MTPRIPFWSTWCPRLSGDAGQGFARYAVCEHAPWTIRKRSLIRLDCQQGRRGHASARQQDAGLFTPGTSMICRWLAPANASETQSITALTAVRATPRLLSAAAAR
jgi:hypothetical protein